MSRFISYAARTTAYLITFLLAAVWTVGALDTLLHPLYDLGRHNVGDVIAQTGVHEVHARLIDEAQMRGLVDVVRGNG